MYCNNSMGKVCEKDFNSLSEFTEYVNKNNDISDHWKS